MNKITKKSFYSFLTLYLLSSFIFLTLASYWFYTAQIATVMNANYYKMNHIADNVSSSVIFAHMNDTPFELPIIKNSNIALFDDKQTLQYGSIIQEVDFTKEYYVNKNISTIISKRTNNHLNISYVVVQSGECSVNAKKIKNSIVYTAIMVAIVMIFISVILSYIFLKPIKEKMQEIENFVKDTTHELNTPISALMMSTERVKKKKVYDEKIIQNISISTKQLYDIYSSLSYISFDNKSEKSIELDFDTIVEDSINYFNELLERKNIKITSNISKCPLTIAPTKAKMLINNLLSNSIKYSMPNSKIYIETTKNHFIIKDNGIGIAEDKLSLILNRFTRANNYAGGFGIGLNIVDEITKEYSYNLTITSQEGKGTQVSIIFT